MSEHTYIAAAIGGKPVEIEQFVNAIQSDYIVDICEIIPHFMVFELKRDLSIFAYYHYDDEWSLFSEDTWQELCRLADKSKLSWVFYRVSNYGKDLFCNSNSGENYFDKRMLKLFEIRHPLISHIHDDKILDNL